MPQMARQRLLTLRGIFIVVNQVAPCTRGRPVPKEKRKRREEESSSRMTRTKTEEQRKDRSNIKSGEQLSTALKSISDRPLLLIFLMSWVSFPVVSSFHFI
jgi:hypothetical protein